MAIPLFRNKNRILFVGLFIAVLAVAVAAVISFLGAEMGAVIIAGLLGTAVVLYSLVNYVFGFYAALTLGFFIFYLGRLAGQAFPSGYVVDILVWASFLGMLINKTIRRESLYASTGHLITYAYLVYTIFIIAQVFNPNMASVEGWFFVLRKFIQFVIIYFIALNVFSDMRKVIFFITYWVVLAVVAGVYGCYQEWFGFFDFELDWVWSVPGRAGLYFLDNGLFRKFSILSDPAAYGIVMATSAVVLFVLMSMARNRKLKLLYLVINIFVVLGVAYSGTRTAYFVIAAGIALYILMTLTNRNTLIFACFFFLGFAFILYGPIYGNNTINRIRSTFEFSDDASLKVRDENRKFIQPYIYRNPLGGGLATSGIAGLEYNPGHQLAGFPPDSGFVKTAVETGWVGFFLQCLLYFIILQAGVHAFYSARNRFLKMTLLAAVACIFAFVIAQYGQDAIGQVPGCFLFYSFLALVARAKHLDK
ncbi:MAG: O-antigen ligase family protein [Sphingobacteriales bacterium]|nr:O-antigen ligase family protein [Sphingobacteriales bacterium]